MYNVCMYEACTKITPPPPPPSPPLTNLPDLPGQLVVGRKAVLLLRGADQSQVERPEAVGALVHEELNQSHSLLPSRHFTAAQVHLLRL